MGYTTDFLGQFDLNKELDVKTYTFLTKLNDTRRMKRDVGPEYGTDGEFYVEDNNEGVVDHNRPPSTQPGLWCQWVPTEDGLSLIWDGGEKFYNYVNWLKYIIEKVLVPKGYVLNGEVEFQGEDMSNRGLIVCKDNVVSIKEIKYED